MRRAAKTGGDVAVYRAFEGQILFELGALRGGARVLEHAVALDPESAHALYHLALVLERLGDGEEAPRAFAARERARPRALPAAGRGRRRRLRARVAAEAIDEPAALDPRVRRGRAGADRGLPAEELIDDENVSPQILGLFIGVPRTEAGAHRAGRAT